MDLYLASSARIHFSVFWITWDIVEVLKLHSGQKIDDPRKNPATRERNPRQLDYFCIS